MNREIKFRAWDIVRKEYCDFDLINFKTSEIKYTRWPNYEAIYSRPLNDFILEQYTGLHDDNGKEIYEGDILELTEIGDDDSWRAVVEFGNPNCIYSWGFQLRPITKCEYDTDILLWVETEEKILSCIIIGNAHENPELLEERK